MAQQRYVPLILSLDPRPAEKTAGESAARIKKTFSDNQAQGAQSGVSGMTNAFRQLDEAADRASKGGLTNAFNSTRLIQTEIQSVTSRIPVVGRLFNVFSSDLIRFATNSAKAGGELRQLSKDAEKVFADLAKFEKKIGEQFGGKISTSFLSEFGKLPALSENSPARLQAALKVLGGDAATSLPAVEKASNELLQLEASATETASGLEGAGAAATGMGASFAAVAGPIGIAVAALVAILAIAGGAAFGLFKLAENTAQTADKYYDLGQQVNFSAHTLSAMDVAAAEAGVKTDQLSASLGIFDKKLEAGAEKSTKLSRVLQAYGVDVRDNQKALEGLFSILIKLPEGETQTALAMEAFGRGGKAMLGIVKEARGDLPTLIKLLDDMGATISDKDTKAAHEFDEKLDVLNKQFEAAKVKVGIELLPVFERLFDDLSEWLKRNQGEFRAWGETFAGVAQGIIVWVRQIKAEFDLLSSAWHSIQSLTPSEANDPHAGTQKSYAQRAWDWLTTSTDTSQWQQGTGKAETHMMTPAEIAEQARHNKEAAEAQRSADAAYDAYLKRVEREKQEAAARVSGLMGEKAPHHETESQILDRRLEVIKSHEKAVDDAYQDGVAKEKDSYDQRLTSLQAFTGTEKALAWVRLTGLKAYLTLEKLEIEKSAIAQDKKAAMEAKIDERIIHAKDEYDKAVLAADRTLYESQRQMEEEHDRAVLSRKSARDAANIAELKDFAQRRIITNEDAENQIGAIELAALDREKKFLEKQLILAGDYEPLQKKINDELKALGEQRLATEDDIHRRTRDGRKKDIQDFQQYANELIKLQQDNLQAEIDLANERLNLLGQLGAKDSDVRQAQAALDIRAENLRHQGALNEIKAEKASVNLRQYTTEQKAAIESAYNAKIETEAQRHALKVEEIELRPLIRFREQVAKIAGEVGDIFGEAFSSIFDKGKSFWQTLGDGFRQLWQQIVQDFISSRVKQVIESLFFPQPTSATASASSGGGFSGLLRSIFGGGGAAVTTPPFAGGSIPGLTASGGGSLASLGSLGSVLASQLGLGIGGAPEVPQSGQERAAAAAGLPLPGSPLRNLNVDAILSGALSKTSLFGGFGFGLNPGTGGPLSALAPLLGLSLGSSLGGSSLLGAILGGAGGALLGIGLTAAPAALAAGGSLSGLGFLAPLFSNPLTAIAGGALLVGALLLGRNAQRRHDEQIRNAAATDLGTTLWKMIDDVRFDRLDGAQALSQVPQLEANYRQATAAIRDAKTRHNSELWLANDEPKIIAILNQAVNAQLERKAIQQKLVPEFAQGGHVSETQIVKLRPGERFLPPHQVAELVRNGGFIPGVDIGRDSVYMPAPKGSFIVPREKVQPMDSGGFVGAPPASPAPTAQGQLGRFSFNVHVYQEGTGDIKDVVLEVMDSHEGGRVIHRQRERARLHKRG